MGGVAEAMRDLFSALKPQKRRLIQYVLSAAVFCCAYGLYRGRSGGGGVWTEALFLTALLMAVLGCWALVRRLGLFDLTEYSWKRFVRGLSRWTNAERDPMPAYAEWLQEPRERAGLGEPLLCALVFFVLYLIAEFLLKAQ